MLIDDVKISVAAGNGGKGAVAFNAILKNLGRPAVRAGAAATFWRSGYRI